MIDIALHQPQAVNTSSQQTEYVGVVALVDWGQTAGSGLDVDIIPEWFDQALADVTAGRLVDLDVALSEPPPDHSQTV